MGLDMKAVARVPGQIHEDVQLAEWRKHNALHGWMTNLAIEKNLVANQDEFNCIELRLTEKDLNTLRRDILEDKLIHTQGFFFGDKYDISMYKLDDMNFIREAISYLTEGYQIYYSSWW